MATRLVYVVHKSIVLCDGSGAVWWFALALKLKYLLSFNFANVIWLNVLYNKWKREASIDSNTNTNIDLLNHFLLFYCICLGIGILCGNCSTITQSYYSLLILFVLTDIANCFRFTGTIDTAQSEQTASDHRCQFDRHTNQTIDCTTSTTIAAGHVSRPRKTAIGTIDTALFARSRWQ